MGEKLNRLLEEYGRIGLVIFFVLFALTYLGFLTAIKLGFHTKSSGGNVGAFFAAWLATKLTMPLRLLATAGLTPIVSAAYRRVRPNAQ